ncbi:Hypotheticale protein [Strongyloides ratti]|uniref:Hypotheticale protein n=1 Tax=Strongyloides ratti TaxID=34506 RepID=A0A090MQ43_STRRB|nr:Hypotheticale protein [Strongyloides ratti]CEF60258.1 Hypotheticale protein [Strongyloides ratti]
MESSTKEGKAVISYDNYDDKSKFLVYIKLRTSQMSADDELSTVLSVMPDDWENEMYTFLIDAEIQELTFEAVVEFLEEKISDDQQHTIMLINILDLFSITFRKKDNAFSNLHHRVSSSKIQPIKQSILRTDAKFKIKRFHKGRKSDIQVKNMKADGNSLKLESKYTSQMKNNDKGEKKDYVKDKYSQNKNDKGSVSKSTVKDDNFFDNQKESSKVIQYWADSKRNFNICKTTCVVQDKIFEVGIDTCAGISSMPEEWVKKLTNIEMTNIPPIVVTSIHGTTGRITQCFETVISIPNHIEKVPIVIHINSKR